MNAARVVLALLLAAAVLPFAAAGQSAGPGAGLLEQAAESFFNESLAISAVRALLDRSKAAFAGLEDDCQRAYWQARVEYLYGFVEQADGQPKAGEARFQNSLNLAARSLECGESSEGYRLMADAQAQLLVSGGPGYKMTHGGKARQWVLRAVELDPDNVAAQLSLALYYRNAPGLAGGDPKEARRILHALEARSDLERAERFSVNTWLGISYADSKDRERARAYLSRAQAAYPGNTWVREMLTQL